MGRVWDAFSRKISALGEVELQPRQVLAAEAVNRSAFAASQF